MFTRPGQSSFFRCQTQEIDSPKLWPTWTCGSWIFEEISVLGQQQEPSLRPRESIDHSRLWPLDSMEWFGENLYRKPMWFHVRIFNIKYRRKQNPSCPSSGLLRKCVWPVIIQYPSSTFPLKHVEVLQKWSPWKSSYWNYMNFYSYF